MGVLEVCVYVCAVEDWDAGKWNQTSNLLTVCLKLATTLALKWLMTKAMKLHDCRQFQAATAALIVLVYSSKTYTYLPTYIAS